MRSNLLSRLKPEFKKGLEDNKVRYPSMTNDIEFLLTQIFYYDDLTVRQVLNIFVFSDMEFDYCGSLTNYQVITKQYEAAGYEMPKIVFWTLNARAGNNPVRVGDNGTALVSGFSPSIMKSLFAGDLNPEAVMLSTVMKPRYDLDVAA